MIVKSSMSSARIDLTMAKVTSRSSARTSERLKLNEEMSIVGPAYRDDESELSDDDAPKFKNGKRKHTLKTGG